MKVEELLTEKESDILKKWVNKILEQYPADTKKFLMKNHDQFTNPVGHTLFEVTEELYEQLIGNEDINPEKFSPILDRLIRTKAIQDFTPSQCLSDLFSLKSIIRIELKKDIRDVDLFRQLLVIEERIDKVALIAFDIFMECREKLFEIAANQTRNQVSSLLRRTGLISEIPEWDPYKLEGNTT